MLVSMYPTQICPTEKPYMSRKVALVTGAGGFIGHHLVSYLRNKDYFVRGADIKAPDFGRSAADEFLTARSTPGGQLPSSGAGADESLPSSRRHGWNWVYHQLAR